MRIGVISDTHAHSLQDIPYEVVETLKNVDLIIHAGDIVKLRVLEELRQLAKVKAVKGNMDSMELKDLLPERELVVVDGKKIGVIHGWGGSWGMERRIKVMFDGVDVIVFGHTHEIKNRLMEGILFFNPGQARKSFGILTVEEDIRGEIIKL